MAGVDGLGQTEAECVREMGRCLRETGEVVNPGTERIEVVEVVAVLLDDNRQPIGYAEGYAENVEPGAKRAFELSTTFAAIELNEVAHGGICFAAVGPQRRVGSRRLADSWSDLHAASPPSWYVGRPSRRHGGQWAIYAFDTTERPT